MEGQIEISKTGKSKLVREKLPEGESKRLGRDMLYRVLYPKEGLQIDEAREDLKEVYKELNADVVEYERANKTTYVYLTLDVYLALEMAFSMGFDAVEACAAAKISRRKYNKLIEKYPLLLDRIEHWKANPVMLAKSVVMEQIGNGNLQAAQWWLERRKKDEFSQSTKLEINKTERKHIEVSTTIKDIEDIRNRIPIQIADDNRDNVIEIVDDKKDIG